MAVSEIPQLMRLWSVALSSALLLFICFRYRIIRSRIDFNYHKTLDRRLQELREECLNPSTLRSIAGQIRSILGRGREPLCLPRPESGCQNRLTSRS
jgi:hypothetical protein